MCRDCDPAGHGFSRKVPGGDRVHGRSSPTSRRPRFGIRARFGIQAHLVRAATLLWRILSAIYVRHDGLPLHAAAMTPFSTSALIREVIHEAEKICREAAP